MIQLLIGSFLLSLVHAAIPNHWLPIILIGKAENWPTKESVSVAALSGLLHTLSTILLGTIIGYIGWKLSERSEEVTRAIASLILIFMGVIYFGQDLRHHHHDHLPKTDTVKKKSKRAIVFSFALAMFFSPCLEIETYYFKAGTLGFLGIAMVSVVYLCVTVSAMSLFVYAGSRSLERVNFHFLDHHEKKITGGILIVLGIISYFIHF